MGEERLSSRVAYRAIVGVRTNSFGLGKDWMGRLEEGLKDFGIKSEGHIRPADGFG